MIRYSKKNAVIGMVAVTTLAVAAVTVPALATHQTVPNGFVPTQLTKGVFGPFDVKAEKNSKWDLAIKSHGQTDLRVTSVVWAPGASSGWHSHPGPNLLTVKSGSVTEYEGSDPVCPNRTYNAGDTFGDNGGSAIHLVRNEGTIAAEVIAVAFYPHATGTPPVPAPTVGNKPIPTNCIAAGAPAH